MSGDDDRPRPTTKRDRGAEAHRVVVKARRERFLHFHDLRQGRGLEIGPLDAGIADPASDVRYGHVFDAEGIRRHYAEDPNVLLELIPDTHYPLIADGKSRSLAEAAAPGAPYDWVLVSHVIEHVPDVIGWLRDLAEISADGAALVLAVPDRRYCFDRHRPQTRSARPSKRTSVVTSSPASARCTTPSPPQST